jgi:hypothetical protein
MHIYSISSPAYIVVRRPIITEVFSGRQHNRLSAQGQGGHPVAFQRLWSLWSDLSATPAQVGVDVLQMEGFTLKK